MRRLAMMNYVLIALFNIKFSDGHSCWNCLLDTFPLVYNVPSFEKTTMRHFLQLNGIGQLFIHVGIYSGTWSLFIELSGIGIILMCLALLSLTSSSLDIVKQKIRRSWNLFRTLSTCSCHLCILHWRILVYAKYHWNDRSRDCLHRGHILYDDDVNRFAFTF